MDKRTFEMVKAGDQLSFNISKQITPWLLILQWYMRVRNVTLGGLKGYSGEKCISRKKTPPSYTDPGGPRIVETHSYKLSPLGPALQFGGGSKVISANSFWILLAEVLRAFDILGFGLTSLFSVLAVSGTDAAPLPRPVPLEPAPDISFTATLDRISREGREHLVCLIMHFQ